MGWFPPEETMSRVNKLRVIAAEDHHLVHVSENLRTADLEDFAGAGMVDPLGGFREAAAVGRCWAVLLPDGVACAVGGVIPSGDPLEGICWMMGTDELTRHSREFLRRVPDYLDALHELYPLIGNLTRQSNTLHRRWLQWAGFTLLPQVQEIEGATEPFHEMIRIKECQFQH